MSTFYLNAAGVVPIIGDSIVDGTIIELVDNGVIDDSGHVIEMPPYSITIRSWSGNTNKPTWKLAGSDGSFASLFFPKAINLYDIRFESTIGEGNFFSLIQIAGLNTIVSEISRCHFNITTFRFDCSTDVEALVTNNICQDLIMGVNLIEIAQGVGVTFYGNICNNVFYGGARGILQTSNGHVNGKWLNNICSNNTSECYRIETPDTCNLIIDYGISYNYGIEEFGANAGLFVGSHNIHNTDPMFTNPTGDDFTLQDDSPCIGRGINHAAESVVPTVDYNNVNRTGHADIGSYLKVILSQAPEIIVQPIDANKMFGDTVMFSVTATGVPTVSYEWRRNHTPLISGSRISGTNTAVLTIINLIASDSGNYSVRIFNGVSPDVISDKALLIVKKTIIGKKVPITAGVLSKPEIARFDDVKFTQAEPIVTTSTRTNNEIIGTAAGVSISMFGTSKEGVDPTAYDIR